MLAQKHRFHGHASLKYVYKHGDVSRSHFFTVRATLNSRRQMPRCSVVVSKKVLKSAVGRNRIRRRVYHIVHEELAKITTAQDIVVGVHSAEVAFAPYSDLQRQLRTQLSEVSVYLESRESA